MPDAGHPRNSDGMPAFGSRATARRKISLQRAGYRIFINDRLIAPNDVATREALDADFHNFSRKLFRGKEYSISYGADPRSLFTAFVKADRPFFSRGIAGSPRINCDRIPSQENFQWEN